MKPRPFRLARLLDVRKRRQREQERRLGSAARQVREREDEVAAIIDYRLQCRAATAERERLAAETGAALDVAVAAGSRSALVQLARDAGELAATVPGLREAEAVERAKLVAARRVTRVLEMLRDRREQELRTWAKKREQKALDDLANGLAARKPKGGLK